MSLAVKYRPQNFNDVVEQTITTEILKRQVANRTFKNAYLFAGTSGCGKTTLARIMAKAINGPTYEPIELDGGRTGSVDDIRNIVEIAGQRDLVGEYKIIIIDECQILGGGRKENSPAWSAMLKCIEECPKYTIFIFCSTDPEKIPDAILNRVQRYNFTPISQQGIKNRLEFICQQEGFTNYSKTCDFISKAVHGGMRDAITYLEQVADFSKDLSIEATKNIFGGLSYETMFKLTWALQNKKEQEIISIIDSLYSEGQNLKTFINVYLEFIMDLAKYKVFNNIDITSIPSYLATEENKVVQYTTDKYDLKYFNDLADSIFKIKSAIKYDTDIKSTIEILLLRICRG